MKSLLFKIIRYSGIPLFFRETIQRNKITFILLHDIDDKSAYNNFLYLKKHYNIIPLNEAINAIKEKNIKSLPHKSLVITFDDGHISNYKLLPIIKTLNIPITIFLCSEIVGSNRHFWFRHNLSDSNPGAFKTITNTERLNKLSDYGFDQTKEYNDEIQALQNNHIAEMKNYFDFQSHTLYHPILPNCTDEEAYNEITKSKENLEQRYGLTIRTISYPNGDYSDRDIEIAKNAGYECGVTVDAGYNDKKTDLFRLKRFSVNDAKSIDELAVKASGCFAFFKNLIHKQSYGYKR